MVRRGFSLVELVIVVAIIGVLAAIAIPNFVAMRLRAKRAELPGNVSSIKDVEVVYEMGINSYITTVAEPASTPGKTTRPFSSTGAWSTLGWRPDGEVRGSYAVAAGAFDFTVSASCDVDGDAAFADYSATLSTNVTLATGDDGVY